MIEWLQGIDVALFRFGNDAVANPVGDWFFPTITEIKNFYIIYAVLLLGLMIFGRKRGVTAVALLLLTITISDQLSSFVIKPLVGRIRPCHVLEDVRLLVGCGGGKSFPSSHAVNNFAMAVLLAHFYPVARPWLLLWAALVSYSRVYVGVHYFSDILAGALVGTFIAAAVAWSWEWSMRQYDKHVSKAESGPAQ
jgi:undecaprenyl-diphosphatase